MLIAKDVGYEVPKSVLDKAFNYIYNKLSNIDNEKQNIDCLYLALYKLALLNLVLAKKVDKKFVETYYKKHFSNQLDKNYNFEREALIAWALALVGDIKNSKEIYKKLLERIVSIYFLKAKFYNSYIRNYSIALLVGLEVDPNNNKTHTILGSLFKFFSKEFQILSTIDTGWITLAITSYFSKFPSEL